MKKKQIIINKQTLCFAYHKLAECLGMDLKGSGLDWDEWRTRSRLNQYHFEHLANYTEEGSFLISPFGFNIFNIMVQFLFYGGGSD